MANTVPTTDFIVGLETQPGLEPNSKVSKTTYPQNYTKFLGGNESIYHKNNASFSITDKNGFPREVSLHKSSFCCAFAEMGNFSLSGAPEEDDVLIKTAIETAWKWNKGLITATLTATSPAHKHETLKRNGFVLISKFPNPNTGKIIHMYHLYRKGYERIEE